MDNKKSSVERLSQSLDIKVNKKKSLPTFKTKEVVCLLIVTVVIGLVMGGLVTYNVTLKGEKVDDELQEFIKIMIMLWIIIMVMLTRLNL